MSQWIEAYWKWLDLRVVTFPWNLPNLYTFVGRLFRYTNSIHYISFIIIVWAIIRCRSVNATGATIRKFINWKQSKLLATSKNKSHNPLTFLIYKVFVGFLVNSDPRIPIVVVPEMLRRNIEAKAFWTHGKVIDSDIAVYPHSLSCLNLKKVFGRNVW